MLEDVLSLNAPFSKLITPEGGDTTGASWMVKATPILRLANTPPLLRIGIMWCLWALSNQIY